MQIRIYEKITMAPKGDRDPNRHPCSSFIVKLVNGDRVTKVFENDQFDHHWTTIRGKRDEYLKEAMDFASNLAKTLGACEIVGVELTKKEQEIADLEASIARDQKRLSELRKKVF